MLFEYWSVFFFRPDPNITSQVVLALACDWSGPDRSDPKPIQVAWFTDLVTVDKFLVNY